METSTLITTRVSYRTKGSELTALYFGAISLVTAGAGMAERWQSAGQTEGEKAIATREKALHIPLYFREAIASERRAVEATLTGKHAPFFSTF